MSSVWLITGAQASGKSTIAELLARQFQRAAHIRGGQFHRWVVNGRVNFDSSDRAEARRLLELRYRLSALGASEYAAAGFVAVVQDNVYGEDVTRWLDTVTADHVHLVVLRPAVDVLARRHEQRRRTTGKVAYRAGFTPAVNDEHLATTPDIGLWLDTSNQTAEETVAAITSRAPEAVVR